jgi:hypothetical protein
VVVCTYRVDLAGRICMVGGDLMSACLIELGHFAKILESLKLAIGNHPCILSCKRSGYGLGSILRGDVASSRLDQPDPDLLFGRMARLSPGTCPPLKHSLDLRKGKLHYAIISRTISLNATAPKAFVHTSAKFS